MWGRAALRCETKLARKGKALLKALDEFEEALEFRHGKLTLEQATQVAQAKTLIAFAAGLGRD